MKLIVHGIDRNDAISKMLQALNNLFVKGIKTTIPFHKAVLHNPVFKSGKFDTSFIETNLTSMVWTEENEEELAALFTMQNYVETNTIAVKEQVMSDNWTLSKQINNL